MSSHRTPLSPVQTSRSPSALATSSSSPALNYGSRKPPLVIKDSTTRPVGSPIQFLRSPQQHIHSTNGVLSTAARKTRPHTAVVSSTSPLPTTSTSASSLINSLVAAHSDRVESVETTPSNTALIPTRRRVQSALPSQNHHRQTVHDDGDSQSGEDSNVLHRQTQRCAGCGAYAELCMSCFSHLKQQDGATYKKQISRSVEVLFERATARAFTKMSHVILQWIFGTWRRETYTQRRRRAIIVRAMAQRRLHRLWRAWVTFIYERRIIGAMLYAEQQQEVTQDKAKEISHLHGDMYELTTNSRVQQQLQQDERQQLIQQIETLQRQLHSRSQELGTLRKELNDAKLRISTLEQQAVDPRELARIRTENSDAKKMVLQLATVLMQSMETQLEVLASSEGRQNLQGMLSKDVVQLLDKPEHPSFFNPLVDLAAAAESANVPLGGSAYDAPVDRADRILLQWVNTLLQRPQSVDWITSSRVTNFHSSWSDGKALTVLTKVLHAAMAKVRPRRPPGMTASKLEAASVLRENGEDLTEIAMERYVDHIKREETPLKRLDVMISTIGQALWMPVGLLNAKDILSGDAEINFATLTYLFCTSATCLEDAQVAMHNDLKVQLSSVKGKWRELGGTLSNSTSSTTATPSTLLQTNGSVPTTTVSLDDEGLMAKLKLVLAQSLELKKRLDGEDTKAREGHLLWWKSARVVLRKCFLSYARLARGKAGVLAKLETAPDENEAFAKMPPRSRLSDLELPFEDGAWEMKLLQSYLTSVHCDLARIYRGYATRTDASNQQITSADFMELVTECRVVDGLIIAVPDIQAVLKKVDPKGSINTPNPQRPVPPHEFLEALIRIARKKYSGDHHRVTLSEAFGLLIDNFILPFAFRADADLFQQQIESPKIRRLLIKHADELREMYSEYAVVAEDARRKNTRKRPRMTAFTFSQCLLDRNVLDVTFNSEKALGIVQRVARTAKKEAAAEAAATGSMGIVMDVDELTFDEFEEAMIVTACYKFPDPYISLESRVEKFLTVFVRSSPAVPVGAGSNTAAPRDRTQ